MPVIEHPGAMIRRALDECGMSQSYLAFATGYTLKHVNQIVVGHVGVTPAVALRIEREVDGIDARALLHAQADYDLERARDAR